MRGLEPIRKTARGARRNVPTPSIVELPFSLSKLKIFSQSRPITAGVTERRAESRLTEIRRGLVIPFLLIMPIPQSIFRYAQAVRRRVHAHPELSAQEWHTASYLQAELEALGWSLVTIPDTPSFLAVWNPRSERFIGYRTELDALPIAEATDLPYASENAGIMHACGHDMHMAIAMGLAKMLAEGSAVLPTCGDTASCGVVLVFESSEELLPGGAPAILSSSEFARYRPQSIFAFHADPSLATGQIGFHPGPFMASCDELYITVSGQGGHGAMPHLTTDPVLAAAHVVVALQAVRARMLPPFTPSVLTIGRVEALGATNVIPHQVKMQGTFRTHDEEVRRQAHARIATVAERVAESMGSTAQVEIRHGYPVLVNAPELCQSVKRLLSAECEGTECVEVPMRMTADDFAYYAQQIPGLYLRLGVGVGAGLHTSGFSPDEQALGVALSALQVLCRHPELWGS